MMSPSPAAKQSFALPSGTMMHIHITSYSKASHCTETTHYKQCIYAKTACDQFSHLLIIGCGDLVII